MSTDGLRHRVQLAVRGALVLHEHEVPDLDVAVAVLVRRAGRAAGDLGPVVVEDLGARPAGAGVAHHPEVVLGATAREPLRADADLVEPDRLRLVVLLEYRDPEALGRQAKALGQQLPGKLDGLALEVVAEAEVAEHLEEGVMPRGVADVVEVIVLAAGAHAALRGRGAAETQVLQPQEHVLELHHAGVGEQERRVVAGHERTRLDDRVIERGKVIEERAPNF